MFHTEYIAREKVLAVCPDARCRRAHICRAVTEPRCPHPCLRTHEDLDSVRLALALKLDAIRLELTGGEVRAPRSGNDLELALKYLKELLHDADSAAMASAMQSEGRVPAVRVARRPGR